MQHTPPTAITRHQWCESSPKESPIIPIQPSEPTPMVWTQASPELNLESTIQQLKLSPSMLTGKNSLTSASPHIGFRSNRSSETIHPLKPLELERVQFPEGRRQLKLPKNEIAQWQKALMQLRLQVGDQVVQAQSMEY